MCFDRPIASVALFRLFQLFSPANAFQPSAAGRWMYVLLCVCLVQVWGGQECVIDASWNLVFWVEVSDHPGQPRSKRLLRQMPLKKELLCRCDHVLAVLASI